MRVSVTYRLRFPIGQECLYLDLRVHIRVKTSPVAHNHNYLHPRPELRNENFILQNNMALVKKNILSAPRNNE